ncbi:protein PET100 homolog, mitochondrial [Hyla sarda]|uniref:protein PET100 homolog, mitochondrial n=1 Tax=Hyla sarda TaxID=327740 RepID=UPI0024C36013|nr:protein PET100 homolog, mitochondrial [Hyla sarda]
MILSSSLEKRGHFTFTSWVRRRSCTIPGDRVEEADASAWSREKMALYLTFPVTMFWISNQPEYFEEYIVKRKREIYPPEKDEQKRQLQERKETIRLQREKLYMED